MTERTAPRLSKLPFYIADFVLIVLAGWIMVKNPHPLAPVPLALMVLCVVLAMGFALAPYLIEYQAQVKFAESDRLTDTVQEIGKLEQAAEQIRLSTSLWQGVQEQSAKTAAAAKEVAGRMTEEAKAFAEFMQKANDTEKGTLRLEVEKLRRAEGDWLQVLVRLLDHVHALHQAAVRSGQRNVIDQLTAFQRACRDVTRRIGLVPFEAAADEAFDAEKHQLLDPADPVPAGARVAETVATGYSFQGQILRLPLVRLAEEAQAPAPVSKPAPAVPQNELELGIEAEDETPAGLS
jgi:molecular chaperone GrpE (heat shock protein)